MVLVEFALLNISVERGLKTFAVLYYLFFFLIAPPFSIFLAIYLLFTSFWWIVVLYAVWFVYDYRTPERCSRPLFLCRNSSLWTYFADYFPMKLIKTCEIPSENCYIFGCHPHGVMSMGTFTTFCTNGTGFNEKFPGITAYLATLEGQFWFPFRREYILTYGIISCKKKSIKYALEMGKGVGVAVVLGGALEALDAHRDCYDLILLKRKGFIKLALETGAHLVPVYNFGENDIFNQVSNERGSFLRSFQEKLSQYTGFSSPIFSGCGIFNYKFGILPFRKAIHTVVGRPIAVERKINPTSQEIDELHEIYCTELQTLFDSYKTKHGIDENIHLKFY